LYFLVTAIVVVIVTTGQVIFSMLSAYAFARLRFWGRNTLFLAYLATLMVPNIVTLIPLFIVMKDLGWINSILGIAAPYMFGTPFGIFLARQFFLGIPHELLEAGRMDGATEWGVFWRIVVPISRPLVATLLIITSVQSWNNFLWPLIVGGTPRSTVLTVGIGDLSTAVVPAYGPMMAAAVVVLLPILCAFLLFQRRIVSSIALTGIK
jgi:multiple sugar transport system permease protein